MSHSTEQASRVSPAPGAVAGVLRWLCQVDLAVWLACAVAVFAFLGSREIDGIRERRLAGTVADIDRNGHWLLPYMQGRPRFLKPPLSDWCAVASMRLLGRSEFSFRLPFALAAFGMVVLSHVLARRLIGAEAGRSAALILATSLYFVSKAHSASTDMPLSLFAACALTAWWFWQTAARPWSPGWWSFYLSLGLACFSKGPVALAVVAIPILLELWSSGRWRLGLAMRPCWGLLLVLAVALPWPIAVWLHIDNVVSLWMEDMNLSLAHDKGAGWLDHLSHLGNWAWFSFPWTVLGIGALGLPLLRRSLENWPSIRFVYCWLVGDLAFFCTWARQPLHYLIPLCVPLAVLEAALWHHALGIIRRVQLHWFTVLVKLGLLLGFVTLAASAGLSMYLRGLLGIVPALALTAVLALPIVLARGCWHSRPQRAFALLAATGVVGASVFSGWIEPQQSLERSCATFARGLVAQVPAGEPVYCVGMEEALPFYADCDFRMIRSAVLPEQLVMLGHGYLLTTRHNYEVDGKLLRAQTAFQVVLEEQNHARAEENYVLLRFSPAAAPAEPERRKDTGPATATSMLDSPQAKPR